MHTNELDSLTIDSNSGCDNISTTLNLACFCGMRFWLEIKDLNPTLCCGHMQTRHSIY